MPTVGRFVAVLLLTWSMSSAALPGEENFSAQTSRIFQDNWEEIQLSDPHQPWKLGGTTGHGITRRRRSVALMSKKRWNRIIKEKMRKEQSKAQKILAWKMLAGLLNGVDVNRDAAAFPNFEDPLERKLPDEPWMLGQTPHLGPRDRKAPCKNFFWKTFTAC